MLRILSFWFLAGAPLLPAATITYTFQDLGTLGGAQSWAYALNNRGWVVGQSQGADGDPGGAFLYRPGIGMEQIPDAGAAEDINDAGVVIGGGFILRPGESPVPIAPGETDTLRSRAINESGQVAGMTYSPEDPPLIRAFVYTPGVGLEFIQGLDPQTSQLVVSGINEAGQVLVYEGIQEQHAFIYTPGEGLTEIPCGGGECRANAINDAGFVAVEAGSFFNRQPYLYDPANGLLDLTIQGWGGGSATGINNRNWVVGEAGNPDGVQTLFLYKPENGGVLIDLAEQVAPFGGIFYDAWDINDQGQIVGSALYGDYNRAFLLTPISNPIPEPATYVLLFSGVLAFAALRSRFPRQAVHPFR